MADRAQLEGWIAATQRTRRRLTIGLVPGLVAAIAVLVWSRPLGGLALVSLAIVALFGLWITSSHISDWEAQLREPAKPRTLNVHGRARREPD